MPLNPLVAPSPISLPRASAVPRVGGRLRDLMARERVFVLLLAAGFAAAAMVFRTPEIAMWFGFAVAAYSVVANDSIQTIGTFIASNKDQKWWVLWLFIGGIFVLTIGASWLNYGGDVTNQRLASKGFGEAPTEFSYLQIAAPLFLLLLTRLRMPVSTTFLLLSSFATTASSVGSILSKSLLGWALAFGAAFAVWFALSRVLDRWFVGTPHPAWRVGQWITSGLLWSVWVMQDAANIAVYLPRSLSLLEVLVFVGVVFLGLGVLFRSGGERVQKVVDEKSKVVDVRSATVIDLVYAAVLYYFKVYSNVPMSTTWVFIGLLGGRELAMALRGSSGLSVRQAARMMGKDLLYVSIGLLVSLLIAYSVNDAFRGEIHSMFG